MSAELYMVAYVLVSFKKTFVITTDIITLQLRQAHEKGDRSMLCSG